MYKLIDPKGATVLMKRTKEPFIYTTEHTARMGRDILSRRRRMRLRIVPV